MKMNISQKKTKKKNMKIVSKMEKFNSL